MYRVVQDVSIQYMLKVAKSLNYIIGEMINDCSEEVAVGRNIWFVVLGFVVPT